ncbi:hypothetical protein [Sphingomonas colocasiae]|uniref:Uncharacterized protein n=1 Tax=Sphingomonas colocasiae TaxID=1848973 RepID=A0ABS7PUK8_9SPHN|nr:hypothetical protein [Sphingomonas colocasiae]MBY8825038.1 hypothetical protein [Sphingomonas colocasiae]
MPTRRSVDHLCDDPAQFAPRKRGGCRLAGDGPLQAAMIGIEMGKFGIRNSYLDCHIVLWRTLRRDLGEDSGAAGPETIPAAPISGWIKPTGD